MNKTLSIFASFFFGLTTAASLLQCIIYLLIGPEIFARESFISWFCILNIVSLSGSLLLLKYYYAQQYWVTLSAATIATIANAFFAGITYVMLVSRGWENYYLPAMLCSLCAGIVYACSLLFSDTRKCFWLKLAGAFMLILGLILTSTMIASMIPQTEAIKKILERIAQWASLAGSLTPILFILHLLSEIKKIKVDDTNTPIQKSLLYTGGVMGILAFILTITFGITLATESYTTVYWRKKNFENTIALANLFEAHTFVNSKGDTLFYRLLKPLNYDTTKRYPLVVSLPYGGQPATDKIRQIEGAAAMEMLSTDINREKYPAFLFIPHCPPGSGWGGIPNYPSVDSLVYEAIWSLDDQYAIDTTRRYVTGISRGGYGAWNFICTHPEMFAAAIPICGGGDPAQAPKAFTVAIWAFHGKNDKNVPVSGSRDMIAAIQKAGGHPKYTEYPNEGHNISYQVGITPGLLDWLFAQRRSK
jgi:hypothetical protein